MAPRSAILAAVSVLTLAAIACSSAVSTPAAQGTAPNAASSPSLPSASEAAATPIPGTSTPQSADATPEPAPASAARPARIDVPEVKLLDPDARPPEFLQSRWKTDFSRHTVSYDEILSGGPPRDGIPPIDNPVFASVAQPPLYMGAKEPVIALEINGDARAYPLAVLIWHEIVNDEVGGVPVSVTYCPLCNTALTFDRRVGGQILDFGTSGLLRKSDLVMWDRQTESWWQQITGEAIVGELTGTKLTFIPAPLISWDEFAKAYPDGQVLTRDTGFDRRYNAAPYVGYDDLRSQPFAFDGPINSSLPAMERVIGLALGEEKVAYAFRGFRNTPVLHDTVSGQDIVIFFADGTLSAFDNPKTVERQAVGSTGVFSPSLDGRDLRFAVEDGVIVDEQTGSEWNVLGQAVAGELEGQRLEPVVHANHFWFAWQAFFPETEIRIAEDIAG